MDSKTEQKLTVFFSKYQTTKYKSGETVYRPHETINQVSFIKNGYVRVYNYDSDGKEITYSGFKPVFLMSLFYSKNKVVNQYYFEALTDLELWTVPLADFEEFLKTDGELMMEILEGTLWTIQSILQAWENSLSGEAYFRIGKLLLSLGKNYGKDILGKWEIDFKTSHRLIASMLGITRETASVQIKKLENDGWISQNNSTIVLNNPEEMSKNFFG